MEAKYRKLRKLVFLASSYKSSMIGAVKKQDYEKAAFWRELQRDILRDLEEHIEYAL